MEAARPVKCELTIKIDYINLNKTFLYKNIYNNKNNLIFFLIIIFI